MMKKLKTGGSSLHSGSSQFQMTPKATNRGKISKKKTMRGLGALSFSRSREKETELLTPSDIGTIGMFQPRSPAKK